MTLLATLTALLLALHPTVGNNDDRFSYKYGASITNGREFGVKHWDQVTCDNPSECLGWPDGYESRRGWDLTHNQCRWCPVTRQPNCTHHRQSPINLERSMGIEKHENERICKDGHWMAYLPGSCKWNDLVDNDSAMLRNNFVIDRHALLIMQPIDASGKLQCERRKFPRIDFAFGFPEWWLLYQTEVKTPSEHTQDGKRYEAEIQLDHVYQVDRRQREIGKVAIFLDGNSTAPRWDFLDKLICQWREVEEATREECCLESVPPYPGCRNPTRPACGSASPVSSDKKAANVEPGVMDTSTATSSTAEPQTTRTPTGANTRPRNPAEDKKTRAKSTAPQITTAPPAATSTSSSATVNNTVEPETTKTRTSAIPQSAAASSTTSTSAATTSVSVELASTAASTNPDPTTASAKETFDCGDHDVNYDRMCKDGGCCETPRQDGNFCHRIYDELGTDMSLACHNCCDTPKTVGPQTPDHPIYTRISCSSIPDDTSRMCKPGGCCDGGSGDWCNLLEGYYTKDEMRSICWYCCSEPRDIGRVRELAVSNDGQISHGDAENPERHLSVNYRHVTYHAYEWLHKVKTEYYFRYVGTQSVPPCFSRVHWRVMKDPVHVHPDQIAELQRLLAWRIAPANAMFDACQTDTAGRAVAGSNGNVVEVNRPLQAENSLHNAVFCECKDWTSKSAEDQTWCNITNVTERFHDHPYSFDTNGAW